MVLISVLVHHNNADSTLILLLIDYFKKNIVYCFNMTVRGNHKIQINYLSIVFFFFHIVPIKGLFRDIHNPSSKKDKINLKNASKPFGCLFDVCITSTCGVVFLWAQPVGNHSCHRTPVSEEEVVKFTT